MIYRLGLALTLLAAGPALAGKPPAKADTGRKDDKVVCRTENEIGSLVRTKKICMTVAEWRDLNFRTGSAVDHRTTGVSLPGGG